ncbi:hypothetical protein N7540_003388 [Penicillium herquei]|nr:hypothetical protein N7540_003388 [Penicillium herquei]
MIAVFDEMTSTSPLAPPPYILPELPPRTFSLSVVFISISTRGSTASQLGSGSVDQFAHDERSISPDVETQAIAMSWHLTVSTML